MRFTGTLGLRTKTATTITVPSDVIEDLGGGKRPRVAVTLTGASKSYSYSATIGVMGGELLLPVSAEVREAAGIVAGDEVDVDIALDATPREIVVPDDLAAALDAAAGARERFDALSDGNRRRIVEQVVSAKTDATRERRIGKAVEAVVARSAR